MRRDHIKTLCLFVLFLGLTFGCSALAAFTDVLSVENHLSFGDVNISLEEFMRKNGKEYSYEDPETVLPGDVISKIPRITNEAQPCWVRVRVGFVREDGPFTSLSYRDLRGTGASWVRRGEYYYYTEILEQNQSTDVFTGIAIPEEWDSSFAGQEFAVEIRADAIQAENFTPDFSAMSPWGDVPVELCVHERSGAVVCRTQGQKLSVRMDEGAGRLLSVPGDFFHNFGTLMPGDEKEDVIALSNETSEPVKLYFHTDTDGAGEAQQSLLRKLKLEILFDGTLLYRGNLMSSGLQRMVLLDEFAPGQTGNLRFKVGIPAGLDNEYALREADVTWVFSASRTEESVPDYPGASPHGRAGAKTGDETDTAGVWILLAVAGFMTAGALILWKRR